MFCYNFFRLDFAIRGTRRAIIDRKEVPSSLGEGKLEKYPLRVPKRPPEPRA